MTMIDLTKLAQETVEIKFDENTTFTIPVEPTLGFSTKMVLYRKKMNQAKTDEQQLKILEEVTTGILQQDESHDDVASMVKKMSPSQIDAVFNIYEKQVEENKQSKN